MKNTSVLASIILGFLAAGPCPPAAAATQQWTLQFNADYPLWQDDPFPLTELNATLTTRETVVYAEGPGRKVVAMVGSRNGVAITGLWDSTQGAFFGGWTPAQGLLKPNKSVNGQKIPFDGIAYMTSDGVQHVIYGATSNIGGAPETNYFEMNQLASLNPSTQWVTFGGSKVKLDRVQPGIKRAE